MLKAVILVGGPQKGTRFRPLSLDTPKPLFPVAGLPSIQHLIEACAAVQGLKEVLLVGYYLSSEMAQFVCQMSQEYKLNIRYLQEYSPLGTAGGIYHFRDQIRSGNPEAFFLLNGDVCGDFPLSEMLSAHLASPNALVTILATEATRQQSVNYGCIVEQRETHQVLHYVEKPSTFVSNLINCGVYAFSLDIFHHLATVFNRKQESFYNDEIESGSPRESIQLEREVLMPLAGSGKAYVFPSTNWWSQLKTAGSAIYANRHYLQLYRRRRPMRLATPRGSWGDSDWPGPHVVGDVFIHPSATVDPTSYIGPNVSIGPDTIICAGVRIRESIVLADCQVGQHSMILHSILGRHSCVGSWSRVEGTPCDPNPNKPFAKMENVPLFNSDGRLNPSITILGGSVKVPSEVIVLNSIVLPHKELTQSFKNEIIL